MRGSLPPDLLRRERRWRLFGFLAILIASFALIIAIKGLLVSTILAFVIAYLFAPIVDFLERRGLSRSLATLIPFVLGGIAVGITMTLIMPLLSEQVTRLADNVPQYQADLTTLITNLESKYKAYWRFGQINPSKDFNTWVVARTVDISSALPDALSQSFTVLLLAPFFAFFMLQDGNQVARSLLSFVPNPLFEIALNLRHQLNDQLGGFIRARFLEAAIVGFVVWVGLLAIGFPYATLLALFAAVTNLIPYLGPIIGAVPAILIAMVSPDVSSSTGGVLDGSQTTVLLLITGIYFLAQLIDILFIIPLVVAKIVDLHPVTVVIMITVGAEVAGILGMIISIPVASAIKLTFNALYSHLTHFRE